MERNLMVAGFGGQGVMTMGRTLGYAACEYTDKHVSFFPSYGAEQRGGTANCYVVIADEEIGAPMGDCMDDLIVMNEPSLIKFLYKLAPGGTLFINSSIIETDIDRTDVSIVKVPVNDMALELGNPKVINVIMLGAYVAYTNILPEEVVKNMVMDQLKKKADLIPLNIEAFERGRQVGEEARSKMASGM